MLTTAINFKNYNTGISRRRETEALPQLTALLAHQTDNPFDFRTDETNAKDDDGDDEKEFLTMMVCQMAAVHFYGVYRRSLFINKLLSPFLLLLTDI
ncbi:hypothetical protein QE152_g36832 [Popillia japonica]|uniref:Uncharacterized protein n=1 Tax=Popillia japonica TaxID=7064 RepID=A0AAW1IC45_POPJA